MSYNSDKTKKFFQGVRLFIKHSTVLGFKEIKSFFSDKVFVVFIIWAFTLNIISASNSSKTDVNNAAVAVVNEDGSVLSRNIISALRKPYFQTPDIITFDEIDDDLDNGKYIFVIVIPEHFEANLLSGKPSEIQLNIDATAVSQAYNGSNYIKTIINDEINQYLENIETSTHFTDFEQVIRIKYNPNGISSWYMSISQIIMKGTMLSMLLPAVALVREKERGTIEHLLVMPIRPSEIMFSKIWSNAVIVLCFAMLALFLIVEGYFKVKVLGSTFLFFFGFMIFQFSITSLGIVLATFTSNVAQLALLTMMFMVPLNFLSGTYVPMESMSPFIQRLMFLSPLKLFIDFSIPIVFKGATLNEVWKPLLYMFLLGIFLFTIANLKFRSWFNKSN